MSGRVGGTIEQMTMMGTQFSNGADTLSALVGRITSQLNSTDWEGGAAQRFRDQWNGEFRSVLTQVEAGLRECSTEVRNRANALAQARA
jgi:WXG100 family type VII secretion target